MEVQETEESNLSELSGTDILKHDGMKKSIKRKLNFTYICTVADPYKDDKNFPIYMALYGLIITPTGFPDVEQRAVICDKIKKMSGEVSFTYTIQTTHLLATHANTNKVELARRRKGKIVSLEWLEDIWKACLENSNPYIHASEARFQGYDIPLFYNIKFLFSNRYDKDTRSFYELVVQQNGGKLTTSMKPTSKHLYICQMPENEMAYKQAQTQGIKCMSLGWISDSIGKNQLVPKFLYEVRPRPVGTPGFGNTFDFGNGEDDDDDDASYKRNVQDEIDEVFDEICKPSKWGSCNNISLRETAINKEFDKGVNVAKRRRRHRDCHSDTFIFSSNSESTDEDEFDSTLNETCIYKDESTLQAPDDIDDPMSNCGETKTPTDTSVAG